MAGRVSPTSIADDSHVQTSGSLEVEPFGQLRPYRSLSDDVKKSDVDASSFQSYEASALVHIRTFHHPPRLSFP